MNALRYLEQLVESRGLRLGRPAVWVAETDSTNDDARDGARHGAPHGSLWVADYQLHGRGRMGRTWASSSADNLLFSIVMRPLCAPAMLPPLALAVGLAVRSAVLQSIDDSHLMVKWPNDVVFGPSLQKLAGVLIESVIADGRIAYVVVGVGLNVNQIDFSREVGERATSMAILAKHTFDRALVLADILAELDRMSERFFSYGFAALLDEMQRADALAGRNVTVGDVSGTAGGIESNGALRVVQDDGTVALCASHEVIVRG